VYLRLQIVVVRCPGAILMPWLDKVKAVIVQFLPGEQAGVALAATLFGDAVSGRHDHRQNREVSATAATVRAQT
jgi:hypothetical protein